MHDVLLCPLLKKKEACYMKGFSYVMFEGGLT